MIGNGSADTIIDSQVSSAPLSISANYCNVTGFTLKGSGSGATDAGLLVDSDFNHIWDCNSSDNQGNGIRIESLGSNNTVENCVVTKNSRNGIRIQASPYNLVKGCTIRQNNENGIHLQNTQGNVLENNSISDSLGASQSSISISSVNDNTIRFNYLQNDEHGIAVAMGDDNVIIGNTIVNTDSYGIDLGGACDNNIIYHNNFIDCNKSGEQASDGGSGTTWHNGYPSGGNYWSDWTTPDTQSGVNQDQAGNDGIVDNIYLIDGGKNDSYPLVDSFVILTITTTDDPSATEDILYSVPYEAWTNMHGGTLTWSLNTNGSWLGRTANTIHGTPTNPDVGSYWVDISVSDGTNQDSHNFTLTVQNTNDPPEINTSDILTVNETQLYSVDYEANDIDPTNDILTWDVDTNATFLSIDSATGVLSGTPTRNDLGTYYVDVIVNDGNDGWDNSNFTLGVLNINDPPVINTTDVLTVNETQLYSVDYEAIDIDPTNDILTWGVNTNATFLSMDSDSGVLSGTPSGDDVGSYYVNVTVNDGHDGWDDSNFTLTVLNINVVPAINNSWPDFSFDEDTINESISLNDWFVDLDGDGLTFSYSGNDKLTVTILGSGIVRLVPEANWSGYEVLTFYANDSV
ncbi:MAG: right-handed parallel beta-helix repeat-containing protein, partial [Planctomycetota bacterium]